VQHRAMKLHERACTAEVARVVEIGRKAGNKQHGRAKARQASCPRARDRKRRKRMCERFHDFM
jgi:hypothetical protein